MNASTTAKTRFEDWQDRRQYLESQGRINPRKVPHIKVLNYLMSRYRDSATALLPARFALRRDLHWNDRRITVHHHLGLGRARRTTLRVRPWWAHRGSEDRRGYERAESLSARIRPVG